MMQPPYESLPPASKAIADFRHGGGQDTNPYSMLTQHGEWEAYAWKMHELWYKEFASERQLDKVKNEENGNGTTSTRSRITNPYKPAPHAGTPSNTGNISSCDIPGGCTDDGKSESNRLPVSNPRPF